MMLLTIFGSIKWSFRSKITDLLGKSLYLSSNMPTEFLETYKNQSIFQSDHVKIEKCHFDRCRTLAKDCGGAIYCRKSTVDISLSLFVNCYSQNSGGAIFCSHCSSIYLFANAHQGNEAEFSSASSHLYLAFNFTVKDSNYTEDRSNTRTGAIAILSSEDSLISDCIFNNISSNYLGIIEINAGLTVMNRVHFHSVNSETVIYGIYLAKLNITNCDFANITSPSITWESHRNAYIMNSIFCQENTTLIGSKKENLVYDHNNTFDLKIQVINPELYGTVVPPTATPTPSASNIPRATLPPRTKEQLVIILDKETPHPTKEKIVIVINNPGKLPNRTPSPSINKFKPPPVKQQLINTQQIAMVSGLVLIVVVIIIYRFTRKERIPEVNTSVFNKLDKGGLKLPSGTRLKNQDDFFD